MCPNFSGHYSWIQCYLLLFCCSRHISCYQGWIISMFNKRVLTIFSLFHHRILENICFCATSFLHMWVCLYNFKYLNTSIYYLGIVPSVSLIRYYIINNLLAIISSYWALKLTIQIKSRPKHLTQMNFISVCSSKMILKPRLGTWTCHLI